MVWQVNARRRGAGAIRRPCGAVFHVLKLFVSILFCFVLFGQRFISLILLFKKGRGKPFWETQE